MNLIDQRRDSGTVWRGGGLARARGPRGSVVRGAAGAVAISDGYIGTLEQHLIWSRTRAVTHVRAVLAGRDQ